MDDSMSAILLLLLAAVLNVCCFFSVCLTTVESAIAYRLYETIARCLWLAGEMLLIDEEVVRRAHPSVLLFAAGRPASVAALHAAAPHHCSISARKQLAFSMICISLCCDVSCQSRTEGAMCRPSGDDKYGRSI